jgi:hypothetical protein
MRAAKSAVGEAFCGVTAITTGCSVGAGWIRTTDLLIHSLYQVFHQQSDDCGGND